ncbi:hypothetical protein Tco_1423200, partial [Tanacetum coccineum]
MMVQAQEEMGEGSANPTDPHHIPTITQPSTSQPQKKQPRRKQRKDTEVSQPSGPTEPMADETENVESVPTHSNDPLLSGEDSLKLNELMELYTKLQKKEDASKQGRKILDIDADEDITLDSTHFDTDPDMFGVHDLYGDAVFVETQEPVVNAATTTSTIPVSAAIATTIADELILAQTLIEIKAAKPKDKGKAKMIESEEPLKMKLKDQVLFDEQKAIRLQAQFDEEERIAREKEEANAALITQWNDIQDKVETDYEL